MKPDSAAAAIASSKATGERLKQHVLADPSATHKLYEQLTLNRLDASRDDVMGLSVAELHNRHLQMATL